MARPKAPKSTVPGTTIAKTAIIDLGGATIIGKLKTVRRGEAKKAAAFRTICPGCLPDGVPVIQQYGCENEHGPYLPGQCAKGKQVGDLIIPLTAEEVARVRGTDGDRPDDSPDDGVAYLQLAVHPADQVAPYSRQTGIAYYFEPGPRADQFAGILRDLAQEPDLAFVAWATVKGVRRWLRLQPAAHGVEFVELARPADIFLYEPQDLPYEDRFLNVALQLVDALRSDFDPAAYEDGADQRLAEVIAAKTDEDGPTATVTSLPKATAGDDLEAILAASLAAAQAGKAA